METVGTVVEYLCTACGAQGTQIVPTADVSREEADPKPVTVACPKCGRATLTNGFGIFVRRLPQSNVELEELNI